MNGIFKLALTGTEEALRKFLAWGQAELSLPSMLLLCEQENTGGEAGQRTCGIQPFHSGSKLVIASAEEAAELDRLEALFPALARQFPELEEILLLQNTDYGIDGVWLVSYSPAGQGTVRETPGMLARNDPDFPAAWAEAAEQGRLDEIDLEDLILYLNRDGASYTREALVRYMERGKLPWKYRKAAAALPEELDGYLREQAANPFHRYVGQRGGLPSTEYLADLLAGYAAGLSLPGLEPANGE